MSAGSTSALTTRASWSVRRRTSTSWPRKACGSPITTPGRAAPQGGRTSTPASLPIRTGLTTVGQAGSKLGMPDTAPTIATALKAMGYATAQFGKNHLSDQNQFLPTVHGFDEFFGYLYHLNAMEDPFWYTYPPEMKDAVGPRNLVHSWATDTDDPTVQPRWGKVGKQRIEDEGPLPPEPKPGTKYNMTTFDEVVRDSTIDFIERARNAGKPFFVWMNTTRVHVNTHLSPKYEALRTPQSGYGMQEAAMAQLDDVAGDLMKYLKDNGLDQNTIVVFTTDNGAEVHTWPDGGTTPFAGAKGEVTEGSFRVPAIVRWPGHVPAGKVANGIMSASTGSRPWSPRPVIRTSRRSCKKASPSATRPTRSISTATIRWT